jgi:flagellar biosynthesis protein FlhA
MTGGLLAALAVIPGIPALPFMVLASGCGAMAYFSFKRQNTRDDLAIREAAGLTVDGAEAPPVEEPISTALAMDTIRLELGYGLLPLVQGEGRKLTDQIKGLRRQLAEDMGYVLPSVRIQDNLQLGASTYVVRVKEIEAGTGEVRAGMLLCMDPSGEAITLPGEATTEPTFGLPAMWIDEKFREEAHFKGYTVVDAPTVITTHITELIKDNMAELLNYAETQKLLDEMPEEFQKLVTDTIPGQISIGGLQRIIQNLLNERISVRDLPAILEGISEASGFTQNIAYITEHVRTRLARQLCDSNADGSGIVPLLTLSPEWEQSFVESLIGDGEEKQLAMPPTRLQEFITAVRGTYEDLSARGEIAVLLTSPTVRPYVRSVIERFRPQTVVMSQNEIHPKAKIRTLGSV